MFNIPIILGILFCQPPLCETGDACLAAGNTAMTRKDPVAAVALFQRACDLGLGAGCGATAARYRHGEGVARDLAKAAVLERQGCEHGDGLACLMLAGMVERGDGVRANAAEAARLKKRACALGSGCPQPAEESPAGGGRCQTAAACLASADEAVQRRQMAVAAQLRQRACDLGSAEGCFGIAAAYRYGSDGVAKDLVRSAGLLRKSCDGGYAMGCVSLAGMFESGEGVKADSAEAVRLRLKACDLGERVICWGRPVPKNIAVPGIGKVLLDSRWAWDEQGRSLLFKTAARVYLVPSPAGGRCETGLQAARRLGATAITTKLLPAAFLPALASKGELVGCAQTGQSSLAVGIRLHAGAGEGTAAGIEVGLEAIRKVWAGR